MDRVHRRRRVAVGVAGLVIGVLVGYGAPSSSAQVTVTRVIYDDAFTEGFTHNPWNGTNDIASTSPVREGVRAITTTPDAYAGIYIDIADGVRLQDSTTLRVWVHGGVGGASHFRVSAKRNTDQNVGQVHVLPDVPANTWAQFAMPLRALLGDPVAFDTYTGRSLWFTSDGTARSVISLDQIELVNEPPPATTAPPPTSAPLTAASSRCVARIMALGDSLTFGLLDEPRSEDSYRGHLYRSLLQAGYAIDMVGPNRSSLGSGGDPDHAGFGGYTIGPDRAVDYLGAPANIAEIVGGWLPAANPDIIILNIGTNDLAAGDRTIADPAREAADRDGVVAANLAPLRLQGLVALLGRLAPRAVILVSDTPPAGASEAVDESAAKVALRAKAKQLGETSPSDRIEYVPVYQRLIDAGFSRSTDLLDGTHLTLAGGQKFAAALRPSVVAALERTCPRDAVPSSAAGSAAASAGAPSAAKATATTARRTATTKRVTKAVTTRKKAAAAKVATTKRR